MNIIILLKIGMYNFYFYFANNWFVYFFPRLIIGMYNLVQYQLAPDAKMLTNVGFTSGDKTLWFY